MPYLVDGHNLIPKLGLRLDSPDDERALTARLLEFCRLRRARVEVYFDGAPPGRAGVHKSGAVTAVFVPHGATADAAIEARLARLGKSARNWIVVSSDGRVQRAAQAFHARAVSSEEFAGLMRSIQPQRSKPAGRPEDGLTPEEVEAWLAEFKSRPPKS